MDRRHRTRAAAGAAPPRPGSGAGVELNKTCQTCFRAKIRCDRTQDSGSCDRCVRLDKECVFAPTRRRNAPPPRSRIDRLEARLDQITGSRTPSPGVVAKTPVPRDNRSDIPDEMDSNIIAIGTASDDSVLSDPVMGGILSSQEAEDLLGIYKRKMTPHFPFVIVPDGMTAQSMRQDRTCLINAIFAAASYHDFRLQRKLSRSFNSLIASRLAWSNFATFDLLQGLLVHLAWAHYQPRPRRFSQHLHLAVSIISDLRLDRPKNPRLWNIEKDDLVPDSDWGIEELRALIGTYFLCSSSSIILQKLRHFPFTNFVEESTQKLSHSGDQPTDQYLQHIVQVQKLSEELDVIATSTTSMTFIEDVKTQVSNMRSRVDELKSTLTFSLRDCPILSLQLSTLELFTSLVLLPGFPFGLSRQQRAFNDSNRLVSCLFESISASKSLIVFLLSMTNGEEFAMTNTGWIMLSCGLSLAVRLDVLARDSRVAHMTQHVLRFLDMRHSLRQTIFRLQSVAREEKDEAGDTDTFSQFLSRAKAIESWYLRQPGVSNLTSPATHSNSASPHSSMQAPSAQTIGQASVTPIMAESEIMGLAQDAGMNDLGDFSVMELFTTDVQGMGFGPYMDFANFGFQ